MMYKHPKTGKTMKFVSQMEFYNFMFGKEFMNSPIEGTVQEYNYMKRKINK